MKWLTTLAVNVAVVNFNDSQNRTLQSIFLILQQKLPLLSSADNLETLLFGVKTSSCSLSFILMHTSTLLFTKKDR